MITVYYAIIIAVVCIFCVVYNIKLICDYINLKIKESKEIKEKRRILIRTLPEAIQLLNNIDLSALLGRKTKLIDATPAEKKQMNKCIIDLRNNAVEDAVKTQLSIVPAGHTLYHTTWEEVPNSFCVVMYFGLA